MKKRLASPVSEPSLYIFIFISCLIFIFVINIIYLLVYLLLFISFYFILFCCCHTSCFLSFAFFDAVTQCLSRIFSTQIYTTFLNVSRGVYFGKNFLSFCNLACAAQNSLQINFQI